MPEKYLNIQLILFETYTIVFALEQQNNCYTISQNIAERDQLHRNISVMTTDRLKLAVLNSFYGCSCSAARNICCELVYFDRKTSNSKLQIISQ